MGDLRVCKQFGIHKSWVCVSLSFPLVFQDFEDLVLVLLYEESHVALVLLEVLAASVLEVLGVLNARQLHFKE